MAKLPNLPMRKRFAEGGATTPDLPAETGGAGAFPMEENTTGSDELQGNFTTPPKQKI